MNLPNMSPYFSHITVYGNISQNKFSNGHLYSAWDWRRVLLLFALIWFVRVVAVLSMEPGKIAQSLCQDNS